MKITVITGSPRRKGNSFAMTEAFIRAAEQRGHTIERFDAAFLKIGGCHACMTCYKTGKACSFDDDFNRIAPAILESEAVVFTMPVYWYSIPAQIKGVIDRLFSLVVGGKAYAGKKCALIACCEEEEMTVFDGVRVPMERTAALLKWEMVGQVLIPGVLNEGDIDRTEGCRQAAALAERRSRSAIAVEAGRASRSGPAQQTQRRSPRFGLAQRRRRKASHDNPIGTIPGL